LRIGVARGLDVEQRHPVTTLEKRALERYEKLDAGDGEAAQAIVIGDEEVHSDLSRAGKLDGIRRPDVPVASDVRVSAGGFAIERYEAGCLGEDVLVSLA